MKLKAESPPKPEVQTPGLHWRFRVSRESISQKKRLTCQWKSNLERSDWYRWQGCDEFGQLFTRRYGTINLDVRHEIIRPELHVAVLYIVYEAFGSVDHASNCA